MVEDGRSNESRDEGPSQVAVNDLLKQLRRDPRIVHPQSQARDSFGRLIPPVGDITGAFTGGSVRTQGNASVEQIRQVMSGEQPFMADPSEQPDVSLTQAQREVGPNVIFMSREDNRRGRQKKRKKHQ